MAQDVKTPPPASTAGQDNSLSSLTGTVTDSSGAVVQNAKITITHLDTKAVRALTTNQAGQYVANDLPIGRYEVKAEVPSFKVSIVTGIVLKAGTPERADIRLEIGDYGCCEYAASPLKVIEDWSQKKKPFTYMVGEAKDQNTFQGIAKLVYGDPKAWVPIFEANRDKIEKPGFIPNGTEILVPKRTRTAPKLISKITPVYPDSAKNAGVWGDVVLDVALKEDGSVDQIHVIDGPPLLAGAATTAVKQWRYQPSSAKGKPAILKFVVVISFGKGGKIH
jgi:TonB family protein